MPMPRIKPEFSNSEVYGFAQKVIECLDAQGKYFATRSKDSLRLSRKLESELRKLATNVMRTIGIGVQPTMMDIGPAETLFDNTPPAQLPD